MPQEAFTSVTLSSSWAKSKVWVMTMTSHFSPPTLPPEKTGRPLEFRSLTLRAMLAQRWIGRDKSLEPVLEVCHAHGRASVQGIE